MLPCWIEWTIAITTIVANLIAIIAFASTIWAVVVYCKNRIEKKNFYLADIQIDDIEKIEANKDLRKQKIRLCFYNKTSTLFYIHRIDTYDYEEKNENYSSVYHNDNGRNNPILDMCVHPNAPCVIEGYLILDYNRLLPEKITLVAYTNKGKAMPYNIQTEVMLEIIPNKRSKIHRPDKYWGKDYCEY